MEAQGDAKNGGKKANQQIVHVRPYLTHELITFYGTPTHKIDYKTFHKWLEPIMDELGERHGYYWSIDQVRIIFKHLKLPSNIIVIDEDDKEY